MENIGKEHGAIDQWFVSSLDKDERQVMRLLVDANHRQAVIDTLQDSLRR